MADTLRDAEASFPIEWIEEAITRAIQNNARNWRYIAAILTSWKEKGRDETYRRDAQKDRRRYLEDEFADFIEH
jgi:DNA replication protein DnaD